MKKDDSLMQFAKMACLILAAIFTLITNLYAGPTLVVDVDTGAMSVHVGDTGPLTKTVWDQSGGDGGTSLTPGDWSLTGFEIFSASSGLNIGADNNPDILFSGGFVAVNSTQGYAEAQFSSTTVPENIIILLDKSYNTTLDTRDLLFTSVDGLPTSDWNTLYVGAANPVPEPTNMLLGTVGLALLGGLRRR